jgi:hypothetical protein
MPPKPKGLHDSAQGFKPWGNKSPQQRALKGSVPEGKPLRLRGTNRAKIFLNLAHSTWAKHSCPFGPKEEFDQGQVKCRSAASSMRRDRIRRSPKATASGLIQRRLTLTPVLLSITFSDRKFARKSPLFGVR